MNDKKKELQQSIKMKSQIETEIEDVAKQLEKFKGSNYGGELVDDEGFPHKDLDYESLRSYKVLKKRQNGKINRAV